ncbi:MAG TPA: hypothetical protein VFQ00_11270 [Terriglobales bacterium]|nr:hypothetical protein [Terriglobales bacterium]
MRKIAVVLSFVLCFFLLGTVHAQQIDAEFGINGLHSTSANNFDLTSPDHSPQSESGSVYPSLGADVLIKGNLGFGGDVMWRATRGDYQGIAPYRPVLYDFNAVYARKVNRVGFALLGGIGAQSTRFYQNFVQCSGFGGCTNYTSSNHFLADLGGELRLYVHGPIFVAPAARIYFIHNNVEFTSGHVIRYGINIGFTMGGR